MDIHELDTIILAGGLGTRLAPVLPHLPKALAPIGPLPFMELQLAFLERQGIRRVIMALGHKAREIEQFLQERPPSALQCVTVIEPEPLGTGGAIAHLRSHIHSDSFMVVNGDTLADVDLPGFLRFHRREEQGITLLRAWVDNVGRYGRLLLDQEERVVALREKEPQVEEAGWINAGFCLMDKEACAPLWRMARGSMERDFFSLLPPGRIRTWPARGGFIDIGTPESWQAAPGIIRGG